MNFIQPQSYFDAHVFQKEVITLFSSAPKYIGHESMVPSIWDFYVLDHENNGRMLINTHSGVQLVSNICRHRQAIMMKGSGNMKKIICPLHKWSWDLDGNMKGAPYFHDNPCKNLRTWWLQNWRWFLFEWWSDIISNLQSAWIEKEINLLEYSYHRREHHHCNYNWKTFMEIYGDDYHIASIHPGLSSVVDFRNLEVTVYESGHMQKIGSNTSYRSNTTFFYETWRDKFLEQNKWIPPKYGAIWFAHYPNIMIEVYPYMLTISTLHPISPQETLNTVDFFYHKDAIDGLIESAEDAYMETVGEDDELAHRIEAGRIALIEQSIQYDLPTQELHGPYHDTMEKGTKHFHEWYSSNIL
jgi:choline monooxygenase